MKILGVLAALMCANAAFAGTVRYESVTFREMGAWVPANKTCVRGGYIFHKTKSTLPVCVETGSGDSSKCEYVEKAIIPQPVVDSNFVRYVGGNSEGKYTTPVTYTVDQSVKNIYEVTRTSGDRETERVIGTYKIPACKTAEDIDAL